MCDKLCDDELYISIFDVAQIDDDVAVVFVCIDVMKAKKSRTFIASRQNGASLSVDDYPLGLS